MEVMRGRRLMTIFMAFALSFALCALLPFSVWIWILVGAVLLCAATFLLMRRIRGKSRFRTAHIVLLVLAVVLGIVHAYQNPVGFPDSWEPENERVFFGTVKSVERELPYGSSYRIAVEDGKKSVICLCETDRDAGFGVGDRVRITGKASPTADLYEKSNGVRAVIDFQNSDVISFGNGKTPVFVRLNAFLSDLLTERVGERTGSFASAVLLGNRDLVSPAVKMDFRVIGFSHVLAVSGLHLSVLIAFFSLFLRLLPISGKRRQMLLVPIIACFALLTGASASVVRASIMFLFFAVSSWFWEDHDGPTALFGAVALIFAFSPFSLFDVGLWLSFSATLGILLFSRCFNPVQFPIMRKNKPIFHKIVNHVSNTVISLVLTGVVATAFTLPILFFFYGNVSILAPLASLTLIPFLTVLLPLYFLVLLIGFVPGVSVVLRFVCCLLTDTMLALSERFAEWDGALISLSYPFSRWFVIVLAVFFAFLFLTPWVKPWRGLAFLLAFMVAYVGFACQYEKTVFPVVQTEVWNTERNDAVLFRYHGRTVAVDITGGSYAAMSPYSEIVYDDFHAGCIDVLVLTHCHSYHAGTLAKLGGRIKIKTVMYPEPQSEAEKGYAEKLKEVGAEYGMTLVPYREGASVSLDDLTLSLPDRLKISRSTHDVIAFSLERGEEKLLCYAGSGLSELPVFWKLYEDCPLLIYGSHGPLYREAAPDARPGMTLGVSADFVSGTDLTALSEDRIYFVLPSE